MREEPTVTPGTDGRPHAAARARGATKIYGQGDTQVRAIDGIDVEFAPGAFTAIMGPSGSGKSTLMHCMAGLDSLTSGQVCIGDVELDRLSDKQLTQLRRERIGFVFQAFNLVPTLTALENITLPLDIAGRKRRQRRGSTRSSTPSGSATGSSHRPRELSGGQQQRVAVRPRAGRPRPTIVFADEPTGNLDSRPRRRGAGLHAPAPPTSWPDHRHGHPRPASPRATPTGCCSSPTAASSTRWTSPTPKTILDRMKRSRGDDGIRMIVRLAAQSAGEQAPAVVMSCSPSSSASASSSGTLVLGDTINATFDGIFPTANEGVDGRQVRGVEDGLGRSTPAGVPSVVAGTGSQAVDGVAAARPTVSATAQIIGKDGKPPAARVRRACGFGWSDDADLNPLHVIAGSAPRAPGTS